MTNFPAPGPLTLENRRQHEAHEELRLDFLEALIQLDLEGARAAFRALEEALTAHLELEEARVLPALARALDERGGEREVTDQHVEGDHKILRRTFARCEALLDRLAGEGEGQRRALVKELDTFLLLGRVLEHHTAREDRLVYPLLDDALSEAERAALLERLRALPRLT